VPSGCYIVSGTTNFQGLWISDEFSDLTGFENLTSADNTTLWAPRPFNEAPSNMEEQEGTFMRRYCNSGRNNYLWILATAQPIGTELKLRFDDTFDWVDTVPFSDLTPASFSQTLAHSVTLLTGDKKMENYDEKTPVYSYYDSGPLHVRALWPSVSAGFFYNPSLVFVV